MFIAICVVLLAGSSLAANPSLGPSIGPVAPFDCALAAVYTPFFDNFTLNPDANVGQAALCKRLGVDVVWINGGMGEFAEMTQQERKTNAESWVAPAKANGLYLIVHVGSQCIADAVELAQHAQSIGADSIASVPPFYERPRSVATLVQVMAQIAAGAPNLPFYYYHLPGSTGVTFSMYDFFTAAIPAIPNLAGVKYAESNHGDYLKCMQAYGTKYNFIWAPEPKLTGLVLGARGAVLAEPFFAATWLRMKAAFQKGDLETARKEQMWKLTMGSLSPYGGVASDKAIMRMLGADVGLAMRLPEVGLTSAEYQNLSTILHGAGFFNGTFPQQKPVLSA